MSRILHIISPSGFYGAERWVLTALQYAREAGVDVRLAITVESETISSELESGASILNVPVYRIALSHRFDLTVIRKLHRLLKDEQIDIVHSHGYKSDLLAWLATRRIGTSIVSTPHGYGATSNRKMRLYIAAGKQLLKRFDLVCPLSPALEQEVLDAGVPSERVTMILNGTDTDEIEVVLNTFNAPQNNSKYVVGYVGQLIPRKRVSALLDVFDLLAQSDTNVELVIAGDGVSRVELEHQASQSKFSDRIKFLGFVTDRLRLMCTFDLFVLTSAYEGVPRCLMEAMGLGLPVAAWSIPGVEELVEDGANGALAANGDTTALVECCKDFRLNPAKAKIIGDAARTQIIEKFSARRMIQEYIRAYDTLTSSPKTANSSDVPHE